MDFKGIAFEQGSYFFRYLVLTISIQYSMPGPERAHQQGGGEHGGGDPGHLQQVQYRH